MPSVVRTGRSIISELRRALRLVWRSGPGWAIASVAVLVVQAALPLLGLYVMKLLVDTVATGLTTTGDRDAVFSRVGLLVVAGGGVALATTVCRSLAALVSEGQGHAVTDHVHDMLHAKAVDLDLEHYESAQYHDVLQRALQEASFRPVRILNGLTQVAQSVVALLLIGGLLFSFHWGVTAMLFTAAGLGVLARARNAGHGYRLRRQQTPHERRAWYFHLLLTGIGHAKEVRLFGLGAALRGRYRDVRGRLRRERLAIATRRAGADVAGQAALTVAVFGSYAFIAYRAVYGAITLGDLVMFYQAFQRGQEYLKEMLGGLAGLYEDHLFLTSLHEFLDMKPRLVEPVIAKSVPRPIRAGIVLDRVSFRYPGSTREALRDVSLRIRPGESVALVGANGSGKTTLVKLLCRLYDPSEGAITVDGLDLREFGSAALRREIGVIFQDYAHYHLSAAENIGFGNVEALSDTARIATAARRSGADDVVRRLRRGYDTILGKWFEDGEELSIGEWQKIALARAFMRDAQIIVLDEPTSALDAEAEYEVFRRFRSLAQGRTTILISHRMSTVRLADCIYVLDDGRIVESGTHEQLAGANGRYGRLFESQARYYR
jgi:ATP-binding cassette subfamily B protein